MIVAALLLTVAYARWRPAPRAALMLEAAGAPRSLTALAGMAVRAALRFAASRWGLKLPTFQLHADDSPEGPTT